MEAKPIVVARDQDLQAMANYLFAGDRDQPAVALTSGTTGQPVLAPDRVRSLVGGDTRIYVVTGTDALLDLEGLLGSNLALPVAAARIWWPALTFESDPLEHPVVLQLEDEPEAAMLEELVRCFQLSRPLVRREISLIEDARALLEHELAQAREQQRETDERLRDIQVKRHEQATRAEEAQALLESLTAELDVLRAAAGRAPESGTGLKDERD
jgi:hypothetical protein